ncbi:sulfatase-like hydrolase/transferase [Halococcus agarilyticus]|uniref:sulfatase-like hydrolase/transferase n=1 Tax=Halococcus agarilyticus TaxID=1232219 RepID=UPI000677B5AB|nr:sulfatase-like hydrolase/transferase [Halococcus agarilyticus]
MSSLRNGTPPNILWLSMEDTTADRLGCYGDDLSRTPNIDERLAGEGRRYRNAFCPSPVCSPSRSATITGMYPTAVGCHQHRPDRERPGLPPSHRVVTPHYVRSFTELLRAAGYYCAKRGKNDFQFGHPFTVWNDYGRDETDVVWRDRDGDQPFFASYQNGISHESGMYPPDTESDRSLETDPGTVTVPPYLPDTDPTRRALARHYDNLAASDDWIGGLLDELAADSLVENTVVVLWSDHGEGLPRCKSWLYDRGLNVPLIVRWPGEIEAGTETTELVSLVDLARTMLELANAEVPTFLQGQQFLGEDRDDPREYVFASRDRQDESYAMQRAVRDQRYKYIRNYYPARPNPWFQYRNNHPAMREIKRLEREGELNGPMAWFAEPRPAEELYDLDVDPHETENLVADPAYRETLDRLRGALDDWRERTGDMGETAEDRLVEEWWPDGNQPETARPTFVPNVSGRPGRDDAPDGGEFEGPMTVRIDCGTQGASVAYTTQRGEDPDWKLYTEPIRIERGELTLRTKAVRYGYSESDERIATFSVSD